MISEGHYAKKQIFCQNQIIAWSHSSRFITTRRLLEKYAVGNSKLLDYGCGDGTFLRMVDNLFAEAYGSDISQSQINDCQIRFSQSQLKFCPIANLQEDKYSSYFDVAVCMEVIEHCLTEDTSQVLKTLKKLVKPGGLIIISVPIEIGLSLLLKQITRSLAGWLRQGDYDKSLETYTKREFVKMFFATKLSYIERPIYGDNAPYHGHKGFNWRALRAQLSQQFTIEDTVFSPLDWLGGFFSSQVFIVCRN
jgi:2-polyprenyl-3-methyl-5-hydroxy-6-metoxy-1,4-benzoquinol methylase